jgi:glycosyltransferase involved in cell wall biosynthesis
VGLVLVGGRDPRFKDTLPGLVDELGLGGSVMFLSNVPEHILPAVYQGATAVALPSLVEGYGLPAIEAMMAGVPVVASDIPALVEATQGASLLVSPRSPEAWTEALARVLSQPDLNEGMRIKGKDVAMAHDWGEIAERMIEFFERTLAAPHVGFNSRSKATGTDR